MTVAVTAITPQRLIGSGTVVITGSGFGAGIPQNDVLVSGSSGTISAASPSSITFTLPFLFSAGIIDDVHVSCQVVNLTTGESAYFWIRVKGFDISVRADPLLLSAIPGPGAILGPGLDKPRLAEAVDAQRLVTLVEALTRDVGGGHVLTQDTGPNVPGGSPGGAAVLLVDLAEATDLRWAGLQDTSLPFGGTVTAAVANLIADGTQAEAVAGGEDEHLSPAAGTIDLIWLLVKEGGGNTLDRVRLLVNTVAVFDSGAALGLANNAAFTAAPAQAVAAGDQIQLEVTTLVGAVALVGGVRLVPT